MDGIFLLSLTDADAAEGGSQMGLVGKGCSESLTGGKSCCQQTA